MRIIGLMSGSSLDGLDIVVMDFFEDNSWKIVSYYEAGFPELLAKRLAIAPSLRVRDLSALDFDFAKFCACAIKGLDIDRSTIDYIGSHGHTVVHSPADGYSLQIGNGGSIAALSGIPTICDFRMNDIALGGQGAPLAPIVERELFSGYQFYLNLGGIANVSHHGEQIRAFDVCPCNQILNFLAAKKSLSFDKDGVLARSGTIQIELLDSLGQMQYFQQPFPKSIDNEWVMKSFLPTIIENDLSIEDKLATMVEFIAVQISKEIKLLSESTEGKGRLLVTGGGAHNGYLIERIRNQNQENEVVVPEKQIVDAKEAMLIALMAFMRASNKENTIKEVTGATRNSIAGAIYLP